MSTEGFPGSVEHPRFKPRQMVRVPKGFYREEDEKGLDGKTVFPKQDPEKWYVIGVFKNDPKEGDFAIVATSLNALENPYTACHVPLDLLEKENPE